MIAGCLIDMAHFNFATADRCYLNHIEQHVTFLHYFLNGSRRLHLVPPLREGTFPSTVML